MNNPHRGYVMTHKINDYWVVHLDGLYVFTGSRDACIDYIHLMHK